MTATEIPGTLNDVRREIGRLCDLRMDSRLTADESERYWLLCRAERRMLAPLVAQPGSAGGSRCALPSVPLIRFLDRGDGQESA